MTNFLKATKAILKALCVLFIIFFACVFSQGTEKGIENFHDAVTIYTFFLVLLTKEDTSK